MEYHIANETDLDLLAEWNHQLIQDEGHRNPMATAQLRERMQNWLSAGYTAVVFTEAGEPVAYALFCEKENEIHLRQLFVKTGSSASGHRKNGP